MEHTVDETTDGTPSTGAFDGDTDAPVQRVTLEAGARVGERFVIERPLGAGGMAAVYLARDERDARSVAVKVLHAPSPQALRRFEQEAAVLAALQHPGIVRYLGHGSLLGGGTYIAMEYVHGEDLAQRLARGTLSPTEALELAERIAETLSVAHAAGVVHRDVKPGNIVLPNGQLAHGKLLDFGIATVTSLAANTASRSGARSPVNVAALAADALTQSGAVVGTLGFMAPEQARSEEAVDARADVFSLGCTLFACLTGRTPYPDRDRRDALLERAPRPRLRDARPDVPPALEEFVARLLAPRAEDRPRDGAAVAAELRALRSLEAHANRALGSAERLLVAVVLARRPDGDRASDPSLERIASTCGARLVHLADGVAFVLTSRSAATDLAVRAARCALAVRSTIDALPVALSLGRAEGGPTPIESVIERASALLRDAPIPAVALDDMSAALLEARFEIAHAPTGPARLLGERPAREPPRRLLGRPTPCVGRSNELSALRAQIEHAITARSPRAALVVAPPGGGKSRLLTELLRGLPDDERAPIVLVARASPLTEGAPFALLVDALERWVGLAEGETAAARSAQLHTALARALAGDELAHAQEFLGELLHAREGEPSVQLSEARANPRLMSDQLGLAFERLVRGLSATRPLLLVLEDLHWGDRPTVRFVDRALEFVNDQPVIVLALARPEVHDSFPNLWSAHAPAVVALPPLAPEACAALVRAALPSISRAALAEMIERSSGNPFFLEELVRAANTDAPREGAAHTPLETPATVVAMVQARIEALESGARRVLRAGSVFGGSFWPGAVAALIGAEGVHDWIAELTEREWLAEHPRSGRLGEQEYAFAHVFVREAAYAMWTDEDRVNAHRRAGDWLEGVGEQDPSLLAGHFARGAQPARAARAYGKAARHAQDGLDFERAIDDARRGLALAEEPAVRGELHLWLAHAHQSRAESALAAEQATLALTLLPTASVRWLEATEEIALACFRLGRTADVCATAQQLAAITPSEDARAAWVGACATIGRVLLQLGERATATSVLALTDVHVERIAAGHPALASRVYRARFSRLMREGDLLAARDAMQTAVALLGASGDKREQEIMAGNLPYVAAELGEYEQAESAFEALVEAGRRWRSQQTIVHALQNLGYIRARRGKVPEGIAALRECITQAERLGLGFYAAFGNVYLSVAHLLGGAWSEAEAAARCGIHLAGPWPAGQAFGQGALSRALLAQGRIHEALAAAEAGEALRATLGPIEGEALIGLSLVRARRAAGDAEGATAALATALARLQHRASRLPEGGARETFLRAIVEHAELVAESAFAAEAMLL